MTVSDVVRILAPAKINLGLDVIRRREDGYHELRMVMQTIGVYDKLTIRRTRGRGVTLHSNLNFLPRNENNIAFKAARLLISEFNIRNKLIIELEKNIPVTAGLAGGSSDAAATLIAINHLFRLGLNQQQLMERGLTLGADVPFCIEKGTSLSEGIGEILTPLPPLADCHILVVKPNTYVSTKYVYDELVLDDQTDHPDIDGILNDVRNQDLASMCGKFKNVLESVTIPEHPEISTIKQLLIQHGAIGSLMSGSGPSVFGVFLDSAVAKAASRICRDAHPDCQTCLGPPHAAVDEIFY